VEKLELFIVMLVVVVYARSGSCSLDWRTPLSSKMLLTKPKMLQEIL
jgi:hypothetical protein